MTKKSKLVRLDSKHVYDLEKRIFSRVLGTKNVRIFVKKLPKTIANIEERKYFHQS
ncbi:MAG: hypothetical protein KAT33_03035 [Bacteroidales bacterium]|nr:hypothetical protein [Bacteroidales bacterium]